MSKYEPRRLGERLLDACISMAIGAAAVYAAVWLIQQVWVWLASGVVLVAAAWMGWRVWSWRQHRW